jgi:hypothetical protein
VDDPLASHQGFVPQRQDHWRLQGTEQFEITHPRGPANTIMFCRAVYTFAQSLTTQRFVRREPGEKSHVFFDRLLDGVTLDVWTLALALDQARIGKHFKMMGDGRWSDSLKVHEVSTGHFFLCEDGLKNRKPGGIRQSL